MLISNALAAAFFAELRAAYAVSPDFKALILS